MGRKFGKALPDCEEKKIACRNTKTVVAFRGGEYIYETLSGGENSSAGREEKKKVT